MFHFNVYLDDEVNLKERTKLKLEFDDMKIGVMTVKDLKNNLSSMHSELPANYDLTFFGRRLKSDQDLLSNYGIKTGANLFVITNHCEQESNEKKRKLEQAELQKMMAAIRVALVNSNFRSMLNRLYDREFRENIVACTPGLRDNIVAFSILQDPDLMMLMCTDNDNLTKIAEKYSVFAEAAVQLATAYHEEVAASSVQSNASGGQSLSNFGRNAYSLNYESDDDLGGVDAAPPEGQQVRETQPIIQNRITVNQLQQAIQAANESARSSNSPTRQAEQRSDSSTQSSFTSLLNRSSDRTTNNQRQSGRDWTQQLNTMHELGFRDDAVSIQALEASDGNVQEAINWYFILNGQSNQ